MNREIISWIDPTGAEHILSGSDGVEVLKGPEGRFMPPVSFIEEDVPYQSGSRLRQVKVKAREVDLPIEITGINEIEIRNKLRNFLRIFNPTKGDGILKATTSDGIQRELKCRYSGGLEISESGMTWERFVLVLKAFDPYWYDTATNVQTFTTGQPATFFPMFPLRLSSSSVFADISIDNTGDVETWPEWIITGPGEYVVLRNLTTGEFTELETSIGIGETITIETKPGKAGKSVRKNDGTNLYGTQTEGSSLWALLDGKNNIRIEMANTTAESSVQLSYRNRYWGP